MFDSVDTTSPFLKGDIVEAAIAAAEIRFGALCWVKRQEDIGMFVEIVGMEALPAPDDIPFSILAPAFITSELKARSSLRSVYIPFVVVVLIVAVY